jgi:hypothetical protein
MRDNVRPAQITRRIDSSRGSIGADHFAIPPFAVAFLDPALDDLTRRNNPLVTHARACRHETMETRLQDCGGEVCVPQLREYGRTNYRREMEG